MFEFLYVVGHIFVIVVGWFMLANDFRNAATKYNEKDYKGFGNAMAWVVIFSAVIISVYV